MIVELKGGQTQNLGAKLMLLETARRLRAQFPNIQLAVRETPWLNHEARIALGLIRKWPLRKRRIDLTRAAYYISPKLMSAVLGEDIVVESQLDAIVDLSGFAYGDRWGERALFGAAAEIERLSNHRKPYIFLPQAFGPFTKLGRASIERFSAALKIGRAHV